MVDPVPAKSSSPVIEGDCEEVDLPVASGVLGGEGLFLQARTGDTRKNRGHKQEQDSALCSADSSSHASRNLW